ncbi:hypothetical protein CLCR_00534 [Cladophialophora carrionii]|uniref:Uncharacterized protein n=1 Tax=Cladophialophora carrionii TaxID=86049 RepID=A0A1C1CCA0_9EURO|nr:hypothetical protein CLCR_00534 [Cladophialophora carrionii]
MGKNDFARLRDRPKMSLLGTHILSRRRWNRWQLQYEEDTAEDVHGSLNETEHGDVSDRPSKQRQAEAGNGPSRHHRRTGEQSRNKTRGWKEEQQPRNTIGLFFTCGRLDQAD